jgi:hypothetical protein
VTGGDGDAGIHSDCATDGGGGGDRDGGRVSTDVNVRKRFTHGE